ncbi:pyridoxamine 5'-phosphate oxidase family protein [Nonomuraea africana]|uniref:Nitroimidazol reductase NimA-like FMN-containing flavoprotein (Pyridoxamine 5'-phosphate oxidase superfamily) n=1 Tax=Nonomuraea africana TaxID=46171 RepID=A0ABR9KL46_9ACTN|nr:pyridoxamine 5'-phosphate oxidase family protein [Nonomuraea africana]MBE1562741.1 nitroimidazol reductase NimA-like FMN-containing flavoprotein (pyridoxamine 5'-phosphate oxidase superfamily) [Nonomuraea africana]
MLSTTPRTTLGREKHRGSTDRNDLYEVLDTGLICHLGVVVNGHPMVVPTGYGRIGDTLYLHGSTGARSLRAGQGSQVCVTVTHLDGLVLARSVFNHSVNFRSAIIYGEARLVTDEQERLDGLRALTEQLAPGQWDYARRPTRKELAATAVLALSLEEASVKLRAGAPEDEKEDYALPIWAGVLPMVSSWGAPVPDPALPPGIATPAHIRDR